MLAPIATSTHHDSSSVRHQPLKLPVKLRKSHESDLNVHKISRKDENNAQTKHLLSPNPVQEEKPNIDPSSKRFRFPKQKNNENSFK